MYYVNVKQRFAKSYAKQLINKGELLQQGHVTPGHLRIQVI